jgi:hypothetical protein
MHFIARPYIIPFWKLLLIAFLPYSSHSERERERDII